MKTLFLSSTDLSGGAARATYWLAKGLRQNGEDVSMLVQKKTGVDSWVTNHSSGITNLFNDFRTALDTLPLRLYSKRERTQWSINMLQNPGLIENISSISPDVVNLHWVGGGVYTNFETTNAKGANRLELIRYVAIYWWLPL